MNSLRQSGISLTEVLISLLLVSASINAYINLNADSLYWQHENQQHYKELLKAKNAAQ